MQHLGILKDEAISIVGTVHQSGKWDNENLPLTSGRNGWMVAILGVVFKSSLPGVGTQERHLNTLVSFNRQYLNFAAEQVRHSKTKCPTQ